MARQAFKDAKTALKDSQKQSIGDAKAFLLKAIEQFPQDVVLPCELANRLKAKSRQDEAVPVIEAAQRRIGNRPEFQQLLKKLGR